MNLLEDIVVTLVALAAIAILFRRLVGFARPAPDGAAPACANCPSAAGACHVATPEPLAAHAEHRLVFIRQEDRSEKTLG